MKEKPLSQIFSSMTSYTAKEIIKFLENHWWTIDHIRGSHAVLYHKELKKRTTIPMHTKDLPEGTLQAILKQTGFVKKDLEK